MYVFYDFETTDTDPDFGQILQAGVIVTDDDLNIVSAHSLRTRRQPWVIPSPQALLITGITPEQLEDPALPTLFETMRTFDKIIRDAGASATGAGYNSMRFDEEGKQSAFHQNLLPAPDPAAPRLDVMTLVQACLMHKPGLLKLDEKTSKGHAKTTLGAVARQNGVELSEDDAHEAVGDVRATIGLARLIREKAPDIWEQMAKLATQQGVQDFLDAHETFCLSDIFFAKPRSRMLTVIDGPVAFDLARDPALYLNKSAAELAALMNQESRDGNPFVLLHRDKAPILMPAAPQPPKFDASARAALIKNDPDFRAKVTQAWAIHSGTPVTPSEIEWQCAEPVPAALESWKQEFHAAGWPQRAALIRDFPARFAETLKTAPAANRFVQFARRILFDNTPELMLPAEREAYKAAIHHRITADNPPDGMMTIPRARAEIALLRQELAQGTSKFLNPGEEYKLDALAAYYTWLEKKYAPAPQPLPRPGLTPS